MNAMNRLRCAPEVGVYCSACGQHAHSFAFDPSIGCESPQHVCLLRADDGQITSPHRAVCEEESAPLSW